MKIAEYFRARYNYLRTFRPIYAKTPSKNELTLLFILALLSILALVVT
jgi:hypothetical protein